MAVYGDNSDIIDQGYRLKRALPNCNLTVVPECGHFLIVEAPGILCALLLQWLNCDAGTDAMPVANAVT